MTLTFARSKVGIKSTNAWAGDSFTIEMTNVPQGACVDLLMAVAGTARDPGLFLAEGLAAPLGKAQATAAPIVITTTPALANAKSPSGKFLKDYRASVA
jgi:hypothetical protein